MRLFYGLVILSKVMDNTTYNHNSLFSAISSSQGTALAEHVERCLKDRPSSDGWMVTYATVNQIEDSAVLKAAELLKIASL